MAFGIVGTSSANTHNHPFIGFVAAPGTNITGVELDAFAVSLNTWTHLTVVVSSNTVKWYVNGMLIETDIVNITNLSYEGNPPNFKIGQGNPTPGFDQNWNGYIDGAGIWWGQQLSDQDWFKIYLRWTRWLRNIEEETFVTVKSALSGL